MDDLTELVRALRRQGWTVEHGTRHWICTPTDATKPRVTLSSTPSGSRWLYAALRTIRQSDPTFRFRGL
jgi:hypothetical protein